MTTSVDEIADGLYRIATYVEPADFTFCRYLVVGEEALLFHTGPRQLADVTLSAIASVTPLDRLRWVSWGHVENDESGAADAILAAAGNAQAAVGAVGAMLNMFDIGGRSIRPLADGETVDLGGRTLRWLDTPQVPHGWDAGLLFDELTATLLCGDLFTIGGAHPATTDDDLSAAALTFEDALPGATALTPGLAPSVRALAALGPRTLAPMHAPASSGHGCRDQLERLAEGYATRFERANHDVASSGSPRP